MAFLSEYILITHWQQIAISNKSLALIKKKPHVYFLRWGLLPLAVKTFPEALTHKRVETREFSTQTKVFFEGVFSELNLAAQARE